jgi:hypothetical protein
MTQPTEGLPRISPYFWLTLISLLLLYPVVFSREDSFFIKLDNLQQQYAFFQKLASSIHKGYLPVWDANTYGGRSFVGELLPGVFYPPNLIWAWIFGSKAGIDVWYLDLLVVVHYFVCLFGMYRLARLFNLSTTGAVFCALVFSYTGALSQRSGGQTCVFFGDSLLPWVIFFLAKFYTSGRKWLYLVFSGLIAGLQLSAGHIQPFFHTAFIGAILAAFYEYSQWKKWQNFLVSLLKMIPLFFICVALISLPQLYYSAEYLSDCYRRMGGGYYISSGQKVPLEIYTHWYILEPANILNLFGQQIAKPIDDDMIYMGILPLVLVMGYLLARKTIKVSIEHQFLGRFLSVVLAVGILAAFGYLTLLPYLLYVIPLVDTARELGRYELMISFGASLFSGLAVTYLDDFRNRFRIKRRGVALYAGAFFGINLLYLVIFQSSSIPVAITFPFLLCVAFFLYFFFAKTSTYLAAAALCVLCVDVFLNNVSFLPSANYYYPPNYFARNRIINFLETTYGQYRVAFSVQNPALLRLNLGDVFPIQIKYGYAATVNKLYFNFTRLHDEPNSKENDLLNVRYIVADKRLDSGVVLMDSAAGLLLYERKSYYPRAYWKSQLGMTGQDMERINRSNIVESAYSDDYQKFEVNCVAADTLILAENYYPGWDCLDNSRPVKILPAGIEGEPPLFRSIPVAAGRHVIEFNYHKIFRLF